MTGSALVTDLLQAAHLVSFKLSQWLRLRGVCIPRLDAQCEMSQPYLRLMLKLIQNRETIPRTGSK